jgi:hypothetical protein
MVGPVTDDAVLYQKFIQGWRRSKMRSDPSPPRHIQGKRKKTEGETRTWRGRRREIGNCLWIGPSEVRGRRDKTRNYIAEAEDAT